MTDTEKLRALINKTHELHMVTAYLPMVGNLSLRMPHGTTEADAAFYGPTEDAVVAKAARYLGLLTQPTAVAPAPAAPSVSRTKSHARAS